MMEAALVLLVALAVVMVMGERILDALAKVLRW